MRSEVLAGLILAVTCVIASALASTEMFSSWPSQDAAVLVRDFLPGTNFNDAWFPKNVRDLLQSSTGKQTARYPSVLPEKYVDPSP